MVPSLGFMKKAFSEMMERLVVESLGVPIAGAFLLILFMGGRQVSLNLHECFD